MVAEELHQLVRVQKVKMCALVAYHIPLWEAVCHLFLS